MFANKKTLPSVASFQIWNIDNQSASINSSFRIWQLHMAYINSVNFIYFVTTDTLYQFYEKII